MGMGGGGGGCGSGVLGVASNQYVHVQYLYNTIHHWLSEHGSACVLIMV